VTKLYCFIPARLKSSRFPNKMIKIVKGKPLIKYVNDKCSECNFFLKTYVATCDKEIYNIINSNNGNSIMTSHFHKGCISRISEAAKKINQIRMKDFICIVQGDEVSINKKILDDFCKISLKLKNKYSIFNAVSKIKNQKEYLSKSVIKAIINKKNNIINFARTNITHSNNKFNKQLSKHIFRQTGIIIVRKDYLLRYSKMKRSFFEKNESVDMLRFLENDIKIKAFIINKTMIGIDTKSDYKNFLKS